MIDKNKLADIVGRHHRTTNIVRVS